MKMEDYLKGESTAVRRCPIRQYCPIRSLCEKMCAPEEEYPLFPTLMDCDRGQLLWTDPHNEQRVFIVRSGLLSCVANLENDNEVPFALLGCGHSVGLNELYIPREIGRNYYLKALSHCMLCSFPAKPLRRQIESAPAPWSLGAISCALTNLSSASYAQAKTVAQPLLANRIAMVLLHLRELTSREGRELDEVQLTHEELACLIACDRASTTRALHKMEQDGVIELGYRRMQDIEIGGSLNASVGNSPPRGSRTGNVFSTDGPTARDRQRLFGRARSAVCLQLGKPYL